MRQAKSNGIAIQGRNSYHSALRKPNPAVASMTESTDPASRPDVSPDDVRLYGAAFWIAYVANLLLVTANALIFRFADFVDLLHGTAMTTGLIVGVGTGVSVLVRIWLGRVIDHQGPRYVWLGSAAAFVVACLAFVPLDSIGPAIFAVRMLYACGISGMFSCSVIHLCTGVPAERRAELIGTLGTSGFIGILLGPQIGDWLFRVIEPGRFQYEVMFLTAGVLGIGYLLIVALLTQHSPRPEPHDPLPLGRMLVEYWPGTLVAVAMMMGLAQVVPFTFLTRLRFERDLSGIGTFFLFYSPTAIVLRLLGRRWPERLGRRKAALIGLACVSASMLLYLFVEREWDLVWVALVAGTGHALLFPSVTTLGAESFPERYRATGTTLILSFVDVGTLCGAPVLGAVIDRFGFNAMFCVTAATVALVAVSFAVSSLLQARRVDLPLEDPTEPDAHEVAEW